MAIVGDFEQQPADELDYDIDYDDWIHDADTVVSATASASPADLTITGPLVSGNTVKIWVSGGVDGTRYKVTVTTTTSYGRIKQDEIRIKIKDR